MAEASGISATNRAFLKVSLEDITSGKCVPAQDAHVGSIAGIYGLLAEEEKIGELD